MARNAGKIVKNFSCLRQLSVVLLHLLPRLCTFSGLYQNRFTACCDPRFKVAQTIPDHRSPGNGASPMLLDLSQEPRRRRSAVTTFLRAVRAIEYSRDLSAVLRNQSPELLVHGVQILLLKQAASQPRLIGRDINVIATSVQRCDRLDVCETGNGQRL